MRALILGASGQVGQALIRECGRRGWEWAGSYHEHPVGRGLFRLDLGDLAAAARAVEGSGAGAVFLPSGWTWVDGCEDDPERARLLNALAPEAVARACARSGARLVVYSTDYVFGKDGGPHPEEAEPAPLGAYGRSKLEGEHRVLAALPGALVLRTTVVYGPEPQGKNTVYQLLGRLRAGLPVALPSDQVTTVTYNRDLARASCDLVAAGFGGVFNACGPEAVDRHAFGRMAAEVFGLDPGLVRAVRTAELLQKAARPLSSGLRIDKLIRHLGWSPDGPRRGLERMRDELESRDPAPV